MKRHIFICIAFILLSEVSYAQYDATGNVTAIGLGATSTDPSYKFTYQGFSIAHYGLGWYADPDASAYGPVAYLSGFGGIKLFTGGSFRAFLTVNGNLGIGTTTPGYKLDVNGDIGIMTSGKLNIGSELVHPSYIKPVWGDNNNTGLQFHTYANSVDITAMALSPTTGYVGIGTTRRII